MKNHNIAFTFFFFIFQLNMTKYELSRCCSSICFIFDYRTILLCVSFKYFEIFWFLWISTSNEHEYKKMDYLP